MTRDQGYQLAVWVRPDDRAVVAQVYDRDMHVVGDLEPVPTRAALQALMDRYSIPSGRWDISDEAEAELGPE
ncbi:hypothetical protein [Streptacidiphilus cavernicola]|uniref:Uncharacterized protein n=1 Tax=Streptacidiphilus cavernicola TaxID=3342716 RepID=A0ABV6VPM6_9ACTN